MTPTTTDATTIELPLLPLVSVVDVMEIPVELLTEYYRDKQKVEMRFGTATPAGLVVDLLAIREYGREVYVAYVNICRVLRVVEKGVGKC